jgi:hypothetical protein
MAAWVTGVKEVDEVADGVPEQQRPVAPGHPGGLVGEVLDEAGQVLVHAVHVVDEELDDDGVVGRPGGRSRTPEAATHSSTLVLAGPESLGGAGP